MVNSEFQKTFIYRQVKHIELFGVFELLLKNPICVMVRRHWNEERLRNRRVSFECQEEEEELSWKRTHQIAIVLWSDSTTFQKRML
jgi:hypothetical protein